MKVFINARFLTQPITGVQRYAREFVKALDKLIAAGELANEQLSFELLAPKNTHLNLDLKCISFRQVGHGGGHLWEQLVLPMHVRNGLLLSLCNASPISVRNQIVVIHDASPFAVRDKHSAAFGMWYRVMLKSLGRRAKGVVTVSSFSRSELMKYCGIREDKLFIVNPGKEHICEVEPDYAVLGKHGLSSKQFVLAVSSLSPHKNFASIVKAVDVLGNVDFDIAIAGSDNTRIFSRSSNSSSARTKYLGYMKEGELRALYENAACFIHPSLYEGFGLTPIEAMTCGCPVITSNVASLPEVCGDAALYCYPLNPEDIAAKLEQLMGDVSLQNDLRSKGFERVKLFTWESTARKIFECCQAVSGRLES